jgi:maleate isomerase
MQAQKTDTQSGEDLVIDEQNISYKMDSGLGERARIGLIVLSGDQTIEYEIRQLLDLPGVSLYGNRIYCAPTITPQTLKAMESKIPEATQLIMTGLPLDVIAYGCTSGSMQIGIENVHARIHEVRPEVACTAPLQAAIAAFKALSSSSIALLTPYLDDINRSLRAYIQDGGFQVPVMGSWNEPEDENVGRITPDSIKEIVLKLGQSDLVDTVFISCTSVRALGIIKAAEEELGKPVLSSNLVLGWHCLRLAGVNDGLPQFGRLFEKTLDQG